MSATRTVDLSHCVGPVLHQLRIEQGLPMEHVADAAGITPQQLSRIEQGRIAPTVLVLGNLAHRLGTTLTRISAMAQSAAICDVPQRPPLPVRADPNRSLTFAQFVAMETARAQAIELGFTPREQDIAVLLVSGTTTASALA